MKILIIDNYDSFTYNLYQQVAGIAKCIPDVFKNDKITYEEIVARDYDAIIISPGPGRPDTLSDFGVCSDVLKFSDKPVLGVCLGHQGIGHFSGGIVTHAPEPYHGRISPIFHNDTSLFKGLPQAFNAVRYHSLVIVKPLPPEIKETAWTADGIVMGIEHESRPFWGIQYHPESISTEFGNEIIEQFLNLANEYNKRGITIDKGQFIEPETSVKPNLESLIVEHQVVDLNTTADVIFYNLYSNSKYSFWLDSSKIIADHSRFSFMGSVADAGEKAVLFDRNDRALTVISNGATTTSHENLFDYLEHDLDSNYVAPTNNFPFNFNGGYIGYFGYELKSELGFTTSHKAEVPDAALIFSTRYLVLDHKDDKIYIVSINKDAEDAKKGRQWINEVLEKLTKLKPIPGKNGPLFSEKLNFYGSQSHSKYIENIRRCQIEIKNGESYEVCLTNRISIDLQLDPLDLYLDLRTINPAQYSTYLHFDNFSILSSSPEQFLKLDREKNVSTKPIKGTIFRDDDPVEDEKNKTILQQNEKFRAENLMIVDLLRNDFGRVCEIGSVTVPHLMAVETYQTLNHLVSTVVGKLKRDHSVIDLFKATFPGGSITGAPKQRTMEIIDRLETDARGPYTGSSGYFSLCRAAELNIIIRTAVMQKNKIIVGTGGAIISLSDAREEFDETLLKAFPLIKAIVINAKGDFKDEFYNINLNIHDSVG